MIRHSLQLVILVIVLNSCASNYNLIHPESLSYIGESENNGVKFDYKYGVLEESQNRKYAKKEGKKGVKVVAIKITNDSGQAFTFGEAVKVFANDMEIEPMLPDQIKKSLKQSTPIYLLYSLLVLNIGNCENGDCNTTTIPIGIPITIGNMAVAGSANQKFLGELNHTDLSKKEIGPGETVHGLIGIKTPYAPKLTFTVDL